MLALPLGACSYRLGSLLEGDDVAAVSSLKTAAASESKPLTDIPDNDLEIAKTVVSELLSRDSKDASAPWENPRTGARGTVTPIAASFTSDGLQCRNFLASHVTTRRETWLQGDACRIHHGRWEVRTLRPWKQT